MNKIKFFVYMIALSLFTTNITNADNSVQRKYKSVIENFLESRSTTKSDNLEFLTNFEKFLTAYKTKITPKDSKYALVNNLIPVIDYERNKIQTELNAAITKTTNSTKSSYTRAS